MLVLSSKLNPKINTAYASWPFSTTTTSSTIHEGDVPKLLEADDALESLWQMINVDHSKQIRPKIDREPDDKTIRAPKVYAVRLSKSGNKGEARNLLENAYNKYKEKSTGLNLGMACVELLIFQGNFEEARDRLHCLLIDQNFPSDDVEQAIIHTMLKNKEAAKWWEAFITTLNEN